MALISYRRITSASRFENLSPYIAAHFRRIKFTETSEYRNTEQSRFEDRKFRVVYLLLRDEAKIYGECNETTDKYCRSYLEGYSMPFESSLTTSDPVFEAIKAEMVASPLGSGVEEEATTAGI